jgi:hypothetical protein
MGAGTAQAQVACTRLPFVPVRPEGTSPVADCDKRVDALKCQVDRGYSHFGRATAPDGHEALLISRDRVSMDDQRRYLGPLERSPVIQELDGLRIRARLLAAPYLAKRGARTAPDPCEPNYVYLGSEEIFGMGPAFVSSQRFLLEGRETSNVIVAEDASAPRHIPLKMISKDALIAGNYYELVLAHELAHGLMQDLYGVDGFARLEKLVTSRDGHFASAVTDPTLAWIEGFAEGFEAYFGEKYYRAAELGTPRLDRLTREALDGAHDYERWGWKSFFIAVPEGIFRGLVTIAHMDEFIADFLKAERQQPIRDNHYVLRGSMNNLAHERGLAPALSSDADMDELAGWYAERPDAVYSKEGVVAHFVYRILKEGLFEEMAETILWGQPRDLWEFAEELRATLEPGQLARIEDAYKTVFTARGREAVRDRLRELRDPENKAIANAEKSDHKLASALAAIELPKTLPPPRDLWVEFWTDSYIRYRAYGSLDRVNLSTATPGRIESFFEAIGVPKTLRKRAVESFLFVRESSNARTVAELAESWARAVRMAPPRPDPVLTRAVEDAAKMMNLMRRCYESGCASKQNLFHSKDSV